MSIPTTQRVSLPANFILRNLGEIKSAVDALYEAGEEIQLDAAEIEQIDSAALQFLVAMTLRNSRKDSKTALIVNGNEVLSSAVNQIGLPTDILQSFFGTSGSPVITEQ